MYFSFISHVSFAVFWFDFTVQIKVHTKTFCISCLFKLKWLHIIPPLTNKECVQHQHVAILTKAASICAASGLQRNGKALWFTWCVFTEEHACGRWCPLYTDHSGRRTRWLAVRDVCSPAGSERRLLVLSTVKCKISERSFLNPESWKGGEGEGGEWD